MGNRKMREGEVHGYDRYSRKRERRYYDYDSPDRKYRKIDDRRHIRHRDDDDYSHRTSRRERDYEHRSKNERSHRRYNGDNDDERYYDSRRYKDHISPRKQEKERNSLSPSKNNNEKDNNPSIIEEEFVDKKEEIIVEKSKESIISKDDYLDLLSQELEEKNREEESLRLLAERRKQREAIRVSNSTIDGNHLSSQNTTILEPGFGKKEGKEEKSTEESSIRIQMDDKKDIVNENAQKQQQQQEEDDEDDDIDLFGDDPIDSDSGEQLISVGIHNSVAEDWADAEGFMRYRIGEVMNDKYRILGKHGKGVFSQVLKVEELETKNVFAIKVSRNNDTMKKAAEQERELLQRLKDTQKTRHVITLYDSFEYKKHLCLVLEPMEYNLREVIQTFGGGIGITLNAVRFYSRQLLTGLKHLKQSNILHADIKPDNIVVTKDKRTAKICDLGTASNIDSPENEITPLLVSRFYRPPEVILGMKYNEQVDLWSIGCCLVEMYTGQILFTGKTNNEMLLMHMQVSGKFSKKMLKKGLFSSEHFEGDQGYFLYQKEETGTKKLITQRMLITKPTRDLMHLLVPNTKLVSEQELSELREFKDLVQKMFILDPTKRITVEEALKHPFIIREK